MTFLLRSSKYMALVLLAVTFQFVACNAPTTVPLIGSAKDADQFARAFIDKIIQGNLDGCMEMVAPELDSDGARAVLDTTIRIIGGSQAVDVQLVDCSYTLGMLGSAKGEGVYNLAYEYRFQRAYMVFPLTVKQDEDVMQIAALHPQFSLVPLVEQHTFDFNGKSFKQYFFLGIAIFTVLFILVSLVSVVRSDASFKAKLGWSAAILLFAVSTVSVNWETGEVGYRIWNLALGGGFGVVRPSLLMPWFVSFSVPVGAIFYWIIGRKATSPATESGVIPVAKPD